MTTVFSLSADMMENLHGCKVGEEKTLSVPVKVTSYGKGGVEFVITSPPVIEEEGEEEDYAESPNTEVPPAVERLIAKRK